MYTYTYSVPTYVCIIIAIYILFQFIKYFNFGLLHFPPSENTITVYLYNQHNRTQHTHAYLRTYIHIYMHMTVHTCTQTLHVSIYLYISKIFVALNFREKLQNRIFTFFISRIRQVSKKITQ